MKLFNENTDVRDWTTCRHCSLRLKSGFNKYPMIMIIIMMVMIVVMMMTFDDDDDDDDDDDI